MTPYLLNLADLLLALYALQHGGVELNPLLQNPTVMVAWKTVGVGVLCLSLERIAQNARVRFNARRIARCGLNLCTAVYAAVCVYHFYFIFGGAF